VDSPRTPVSGMLTNTSDVYVMLDSEAQIAPFKNAHPALISSRVTVTTKEETALEEVSVITLKAFASASPVTSELDANSKLFLDKLKFGLNSVIVNF
jgi:hypothetical protein